MGKLAQRKIGLANIPTKEELYGRALESMADTDADRYNAYVRAMGPDNVKLDNYVEQSPAINVNRRGSWVEPDKGIDVFDVTTDIIPDLPSIGGAAIGLATAGIPGAVGGATIGDLITQKAAQKMGLRKDISEGRAKAAGAMELLGPIAGALPLPNIGAMTARYADAAEGRLIGYHGGAHELTDSEIADGLKKLQQWDDRVRLERGKKLRTLDYNDLSRLAEGRRILGLDPPYKPPVEVLIEPPPKMTHEQKLAYEMEKKEFNALWDSYTNIPEDYRYKAAERKLPPSAKVSDLKKVMAKEYGVLPNSRALAQYLDGAIEEDELIRIGDITRARHEGTDYDELLDSGMDKEDARRAIAQDMAKILGRSNAEHL